METKRKKYESIVAQLKQQYKTAEPTLRDIGDYISPYNHEFDFEANDTNQGDRKDGMIIDEAPCRALEVAVSGLFNGLCDPTEEWMGLETDNPELNDLHSVSQWCQEVAKRVLGEISKSNFYTVIPEDFKAILAYGTCASVTLEQYANSCVWFGAMPIGTYYIGNDARRSVNIAAREQRMSARQLAEEFGIENLSDAAQNAIATNKGEQVFPFTHVVCPNPKWTQGQGFASKEKKYLSCYYEPGQHVHEDKVLAEEGFDTFPIQCARWSTRGNAPWGFGPGHNVLASSKSLQAYAVDLALAREKQLNPTLIVPPGVNLSGISLMPGALIQATDAAGAQGLRPLHDVRFDIKAGQDGLEQLKVAIKEGLYNNIFMMLSSDTGGKMTAREVAERSREKRLALTPILRLTHEYLTPRIARILDIMGKRGLLPPFPPEMENSTLRIQYKSVLAKAAEIERGAMAKDHMLNFALPLSAVDPNILDNYDMDAFVRDAAKNDGVGASVMRDPAKVEEMRAAKAEMARQQAMQQQQQHEAETAKTLSAADTSGKNALTDVLAIAEQQQQ